MAPCTRAAKARAAAAAEATCHLLDLSHDEQSIVTHELCDPLQPLLAVHLSSTAKGLREAMEEQLAELKQQRQGAAALGALYQAAPYATYQGGQQTLHHMSLAQLRDHHELFLGDFYDRPITLAHWRTLGMLVGCGSLPRLAYLAILRDDNGDEGVVSLADGLRRGRLPSLQRLYLVDAQIGPQGATALAPTLTKRALPSLVELGLGAVGSLRPAQAQRVLPRASEVPELAGDGKPVAAARGAAEGVDDVRRGVVGEEHQRFLVGWRWCQGRRVVGGGSQRSAALATKQSFGCFSY